MGGTITPLEKERRQAALAQRQREEREAANALAKRIVELVNDVVIRPGPKPEERECTHVAAELEALQPRIADLIMESEL